MQPIYLLWRNAKVVAAALIVLFAYNFHLDSPYLWGDEGDTGAFSHSVLQSGLPRALVGQNVLAYDNCSQLSTSLESRRLPMVQYYVGAASIRLFGDSTAGLRRLFALIGALSFVPVYLLLRRRTNAAPLVVAVLLLQPQVLLFARQARYFPIIVLAVCVLMWLAFEGPKRSGVRLGAMVLMSVILFNTHPLAGFGFCSALSLYAGFCLHERRAEIWLSAVIGLASWLAWYLWLTPVSVGGVMPVSLLLQAPGLAFHLFTLGVEAGLSDLDYVGVLPLLAWALVVVWALLGGARRAMLDEARGLGGLIILALVIGTVCNALAVGVEGSAAWALLRYEPHVVLLAALALYLLLQATVRRPGVALSIWFLALTLNIGSLTHWIQPMQRAEQPLSWWPPVYKEVLDPAPDDLAAVDAALREETKPAETVVVLPRPWSDVWTFRSGDHLRTVPDITPDSLCALLVHEATGDALFERLMNPGLALIYGKPPAALMPYVRRSVGMAYPTFDSTRPELTRHRFPDGVPGEVVMVPLPVPRP
jgi:4-amino-4-deoxy-L-arabinose transferase-like glycosyltransferase